MNHVLDGGSRQNKSIRCDDGWQDSDAAYCQNTVDPCSLICGVLSAKVILILVVL